MTLQDDLVRPWFQPAVPPEQQDRPRPDAGPVTTRFVGELPLDAAPAPSASSGPARPAARPEDFLPRPDAPAPRPDRVEVTQPYIPAIREERPEFAKRLTPDPPAARAGTIEEVPPKSPSGTLADLIPVTPPEAPAAPPVPDTAAAPPAKAPPRQPAKRRSLARRVVRRIIGPDLLRKDPPKKRR